MDHGLNDLANAEARFRAPSFTFITTRIPVCDENLLISSDYLNFRLTFLRTRSRRWARHLVTRCPTLICQGSVGE